MYAKNLTTARQALLDKAISPQVMRQALTQGGSFPVMRPATRKAYARLVRYSLATTNGKLRGWFND